MTFLELFTLVSQSLSHVLGNNIVSVILRYSKLKFCLRTSILGLLGLKCGSRLGQKWQKNFHTSLLTPNPVFPKKEVLKSHSFVTHKAN